MSMRVSEIVSSKIGNAITNVKTWGDIIYNVKAYGAKGDGVTDDTAAIQAAITACEEAGGGIVYFPEGQYRITSRLILRQGITLEGQGISNTWLIKDYIETVPTNGFITMDVTNNSGGLLNIQLYAQQNGGAGVSIIATSVDAPNYITLEHAYITGSAEWNYAVYVDGSLKTSAPQGVRDLRILNCDLFQASTAVIYLKGFNNCHIDNTGIYATGSDDSFDIVGAEGFSSNYLNANLTFCTEINLSGVVNQVVIRCPNITTVTNGSGINNAVIIGRVVNKQENWTNGMYVDPLGMYTHGGVINRNGGEFGSSIKSSSKLATVGYSGAHGSTSVPDGKTFSFTCGSAKFFSIYRGGGQAALFFADYVSSTITILSDPSAAYETSSTPASGKIGIYKSTNNHVINIKNNTGSTQTLNVCVYGTTVTNVTDPA